MADLEIERKFLLLPCKAKKVLNYHHISYRKERLEQFYVSILSAPYARYRKKGDSYYQTIKSGEGLVRTEIEKEVKKKEYLQHRKRSLGRIITKNRFVFEYEGDIYELDIFKGSLKGLSYLEIEFSDESKANAFQLPKIFEPLLIAEVTYDRAFNNSSLSNSETFPSPLLEHSYIDEKRELYRITPFLPTSHAIDTMIYLLISEIKKYKKRLLESPKDVEALHQFRIHMRKLRALLQEFESFFDPMWLKRHKSKLGKLMERTNAKRDNDVALIDIGTFQKKLSSQDKESLGNLKSSFEQKETKLEHRLVTFMGGKSLSKELNILCKTSKEDKIYQDHASQPLILVAIGVINQRIEEIISEGKHLKKDSDKKSYHRLRIQFKKLRYLLELLSPIIEPSKLENALEHLKKIQTILGEINDLTVQKKELKTFCKSCKSKKQKSLKALQKKMKIKEEKRIKAFQKAFETFIEEKSLYQSLLLYSPDPITL